MGLVARIQVTMMVLGFIGKAILNDYVTCLLTNHDCWCIRVA